MTKTLSKTYAKTAFVTGYTGQDGTLLTDLLLKEGYKVVALVRRISTEPPHRTRGYDFTEAIKSGQLVLEQGDLLSVSSLIRIMYAHYPDEIYNLAAQSHVGTSFNQPEFTIEADFMGVVNLITAIETAEKGDSVSMAGWRMYQASTSEMYGTGHDVPLHEFSRMIPNSPYAIAKLAAHNYCRMKREEGKFISCGILFNHESEIRGGDFVTQKIVTAVAERLKSKDAKLVLGNISATRDWGYAGDYVKAMHMMLQQEVADDYVIATGQTTSVRDFVAAACAAAGLEIEWQGTGLEEVGLIDGQPFVVISKDFYRPVDVSQLRGDATLARIKMGWEPTTKLDKLVRIMVGAKVGEIPTIDHTEEEDDAKQPNG